MKIRFYLDTTPPANTIDAEELAKGAALVEKVINHLRAKKADGQYIKVFSGEDVDGIEYWEDEYGLYVETGSFLAGIPPRLTEAELPIAFITMHDTATTGKPQFGIYELNGARAIVDPHNERRQTGRGGLGNGPSWVDIPGWRIRIQGKDLDSVVGLYRKFRSGQIKPTEAWDDMAVVIKELQAEVQQLHDVLLRASEERSETASASN